MKQNAFEQLALSDPHVARFVHWAHSTIDIVLTIEMDDDIQSGRAKPEAIDEIHARVWQSIVRYAESQRAMRPVLPSNPTGVAFIDSQDLRVIVESIVKWAAQFPVAIRAGRSVTELFPS